MRATTRNQFRAYDRIVTGLMLICAAGFVFGALVVLGF
jgi:hypothetical protein